MNERNPAAGDPDECREGPTRGGWRGVTVAGLVIAAMLVVLWNADLAHRQTWVAMNRIDDLGMVEGTPASGTHKRLTAAQRLLLEGDVSRPTRHERQRALWEAHPQNRVYLGNYITALQAGSASGKIDADFLRRELAAARAAEPDNARFDYLEAGWLLQRAAEIRETQDRDEQGKKRSTFTLEVRDRKQLDEAMALLKQALGKPYWRRYSPEMLAEQLAALGQPRRFVDVLERTALAAAVLLPDLAQFKTLARASRLYAERLVEEGRGAEAAPFLEAWETLSRQVTEDSFTLIDVLVAAAVVKDAQQFVPPVYRRLGRDADASRVETRAAAIARPVNDWRAAVEAARHPDSATPEQRRGQEALEQRAGNLASLLLPALGEWPAAEAYRPGRMVEYVVFTELVVAGVLVGWLATLVVSHLLGLRWRASWRAGEPVPARLMPDLGGTIRILILGVGLPLAVFYVVTRYLPGSGHAYSVRVAGHRLVAEFGLLALALLTLPVLLTTAHVNRRCRALGVSVARWRARYPAWACGIAAVLVLLAAWFLPLDGRGRHLQVAWLGLGLAALALVLVILLGLAQGLGGAREHGRYYALLFRTLVPMLALAIIVLGLTARPALHRAEEAWISRDTMIQVGDSVGFSRIETDLVQRLRTAMREGYR